MTHAARFLPKPVEPERLLRQLMGQVPASASASQPRTDSGLADETGRYSS